MSSRGIRMALIPDMALIPHELHPGVLPGEPVYFLSVAQRALCERTPGLAHIAAELPCWLPHVTVSSALGFDRAAIDAAVAHVGAYAWATEFENVHSKFAYDEPGFEFRGRVWAGSEQLFQAQKTGAPESAEFRDASPAFAMLTPEEAFTRGQRVALRADWEAAKDDSMRTAVRAKFLAPGIAGDSLRALLLSTYPRPLASVKYDAYWGIGSNGEGQNRLAALLMELRDELRLAL